MDPKTLSYNLRQIASSIDGSENPSRKLVINHLQSLITRLAADEIFLTSSGLKAKVQDDALYVEVPFKQRSELNSHEISLWDQLVYSDKFRDSEDIPEDAKLIGGKYEFVYYGPDTFGTTKIPGNVLEFELSALPNGVSPQEAAENIAFLLDQHGKTHADPDVTDYFQSEV
jgi:hypothetical protein